MKCQELQDHYELYAMGVAGEPEKSEIREHLNRGCEDCMSGMKRARNMTAFLGSVAPSSAPSPKLRRRILASVGFEQRRFSWTPIWALATALSLFGAIYFNGREREMALTASRLREQLGLRNIELTRLNEALAVLNGPETIMTTFGTGKPAPPKGRVFTNPSVGVLLIASNLPPAPAGKKYEMWVVPKGGKPPIPAGLFQSLPDGTALHVQRGAVNLSATAAVAVTLEDEAGAAQPTTTPVIAAALE
jgi:hypothetical protein